MELNYKKRMYVKIITMYLKYYHYKISARPKRSRAPVERFGYEPTPPSSSKGRRRSSEVRNLDQYSTDDEYMASHDDSRRRKKYNMRPPAPIQRKSNPERRKKSSHRQRDTSSSSSSDSIDEQRFAKRKNKRMMVERSKLRPVNMTKSDANKAIFRDRQHMGASMADIQPMEMDMGVTFESVGGVDGHVNSLKGLILIYTVHILKYAHRFTFKVFFSNTYFYRNGHFPLVVPRDFYQVQHYSSKRCFILRTSWNW